MERRAKGAKGRRSDICRPTLSAYLQAPNGLTCEVLCERLPMQFRNEVQKVPRRKRSGCGYQKKANEREAPVPADPGLGDRYAPASM